MLSAAEKKIIDHELEIVPVRASACIEALKAVQMHRGWVTDEGLQDIADYLGMSTAEVDSVATFYNQIFRKPVGKCVVQVCNSVSCWIMGYRGVRAAIEKELGIKYGETTKDGEFTLVPVQCLGTCDHAPAMLKGEELHRDLTPEKIPGLLKRKQQ